MAGFGRTGKWFAVDHFDVTPDLITFAKGVNSGYVPLGGVAISPAIADTFADRAYPGGLTYSGPSAGHRGAPSPPSTRWRTRASSTNAARIGDEVLGPGLRELAAPAPQRRRGPRRSACSGRSSWSPTGRPASRWRPTAAPAPAMNAVIAACKAGGLLPFANFNRIHVGAAVHGTGRRSTRGSGHPRRRARRRRRKPRLTVATTSNELIKLPPDVLEGASTRRERLAAPLPRPCVTPRRCWRIAIG